VDPPYGLDGSGFIIDDQAAHRLEQVDTRARSLRFGWRQRRMPISVMSICNTCARRKGLLQMNTKQNINRLIETLESFRVSPHVRQSLSYARTCYN
jgi:hypothetical protein